MHLDVPLEEAASQAVRVILLFEADEEEKEDVDERAWLRAASRNPAFDFLQNLAEDLYTANDGRPFDDQRRSSRRGTGA